MKDLDKMIHQADMEISLEKKVELFPKIAVSYWHQSDIENSMKYAFLTLSMARNHELPNQEVSVLNYFFKTPKVDQE